MKEQLIVPVLYQDQKCICGGELQTIEEKPFAADIFFKCQCCGKKWKKTNHFDMLKGEGHFQLEEVEGDNVKK